MLRRVPTRSYGLPGLGGPVMREELDGQTVRWLRHAGRDVVLCNALFVNCCASNCRVGAWRATNTESASASPLRCCTLAKVIAFWWQLQVGISASNCEQLSLSLCQRSVYWNSTQKKKKQFRLPLGGEIIFRTSALSNLLCSCGFLKHDGVLKFVGKSLTLQRGRGNPPALFQAHSVQSKIEGNKAVISPFFSM